MNTPWVRDLLEQAAAAATARRYRSALERLLTVLSVYPDQEQALAMAGPILKLGFSRKIAQESPEPLTLTQVSDPRLDRLFCACDAPDCGAQWISARVGYPEVGNVRVTNPVGGRCAACRRYWCRKHADAGPDGRQFLCPRCHAGLDPAPLPNGRRSRQTIRLNQPLVHVILLREGPLPLEPAYLREMFGTIAPDVLEDGPAIAGVPVPRWPDDPHGLALALLARDHPEYLSPAHDAHTAHGIHEGLRWAIVKVFAKRPKHVDPSAGRG
jgi:hypothetical protein